MAARLLQQCFDCEFIELTKVDEGGFYGNAGRLLSDEAVYPLIFVLHNQS